MAVKTVRYDRDEHALWFGDTKRASDGGDSFVAHRTDLDGVSALALRDALRRSAADDPTYGSTDLDVSDVDLGYFDEETAPVDPVGFQLVDGQLAIDIFFVTDAYEDDDDLATAHVHRILAPLLHRHRLQLLRAAPNSNYVNPPWPWQAQMLVKGRGRTLTDLMAVGAEAVALLEAASSGQLTRTTAGDLLRAGQVQALLGQPEGDWLDAKTSHYDLSRLGGKVALCQAVARFANGDHGGLVVVGMKTKSVPSGEEIRALTPVPHDKAIVRRYQHVLDAHLYPPPDLLRLDAIPVPGGMLIVIDVPPQPEEHKPFLVHGAIVDGRGEGAFISVVRRRGESSIPITAAALHTTLATGRALLRQRASTAPNGTAGEGSTPG